MRATTGEVLLVLRPLGRSHDLIPPAGHRVGRAVQGTRQIRGESWRPYQPRLLPGRAAHGTHPGVPAQPVTLSWPSFTAAADESAFSAEKLWEGG